MLNLPLPPPLDGTRFGRNSQINRQANKPQSGHAERMLTELYVEALLVDEELADQVLWVRGVINDELAATAWSLLFFARHPCRRG